MSFAIGLVVGLVVGALVFLALVMWHFRDGIWR